MAKILIIEDELQIRIILEKILKLAGHEVILASNGAEGVSRFRAAPTDLVLTDIFMPDQEGVETISQLRREFPDIKIIAMSGHDGPMLAVAKHLGVSAILQKPFSSEELLKAVSRSLSPDAL